MDPKDFVYLHAHSHYSLLEALPKPKTLIARAKSLGMSALALTDNGALYGAVEFFKACKDQEMKPIIGADIYLAPHLMTDRRGRIDDRRHDGAAPRAPSAIATDLRTALRTGSRPHYLISRHDRMRTPTCPMPLLKSSGSPNACRKAPVLPEVPTYKC